MATVSDQGASNVGAVRILKEGTDIKYGRLGIEKRDVGYELHPSELSKRIVHIWDPPHLLKCFWNNLMTKDLLFTMDGSILFWHLFKEKTKSIFLLIHNFY